MKYRRHVKWYLKGGNDDSLKGSENIDQLPNEILTSLIESIADKDDPEMVYVYKISSEAISLIEKYVSHRFDLITYDYFIYCSIVEKG